MELPEFPTLTGHDLSILGSLALAVSMTTGIMVVVGYIFTGLLALITASGLTLLAGWLWFGKPLVTRIRGSAGVHHDELGRIAGQHEALSAPAEEPSRHP